MSSEFNNDLERMFAEGLQNYEVTPPAHVWANIRNGRKKGILFYLTNHKLKVAVVALLLLITGAGVYYFNTDDSDQYQGLQNGKEPQLASSNKALSSDQGDVSLSNDNGLTTGNSADVSATDRNLSNSPASAQPETETVSSKVSTVNAPKKRISFKQKKTTPLLTDTRETAPSNKDVRPTEPVNANSWTVNMVSRFRIHLRYLIYPSLMKFVYSDKQMFTRPPAPKAKEKEKEKETHEKNISIELSGGPSYATRQLSGGDASLRNDSETPGLSLQTGLKVNVHFRPNWAIQTGLVVENRNERLKYTYTEERQKLVLTQHNVLVYHPVLPPRAMTITDSSYTEEVVEHKFNSTNKYTSFSIPLVLSYNFTLGRFQYRVSGGTLLNVYSANSAQTLVRKGGEVVAVPYRESSRLKPSCYGAFGLLLPLANNCNFIGEMSYYSNMTNRLSSESTLRQKNHGLNLSAGLQFKLTK